MNVFRPRYLIPLFVLFFILVRFVAKIGVDRAPDERFRVIRIIDGDTVELTGGERLRLLGIDCPEKNEPYYDSAKIMVENFLAGEIVEVAFSERRRDRYGRLLGYIYLDSQLINSAIIRQGLGYVYLFDDNLGDKQNIELLLTAQDEAIHNRRGIWSINRVEEEYYLAKKGSLRFHRPTCEAVQNWKEGDFIRFNNRVDAFKKGLSPCRRCRP
jgi:micrococcal nuclease